MTGRSDALRALGAEGSVLEELIAYTENPYEELSREQDFTGVEEPQLQAWSEYAAEAATIGAAATLRSHLVQLAFPIRQGISQESTYRASVVRSAPPPVGEGAEFVDPEGISLRLHPSPAGPVPVIQAERREDFVTLVRALVGRSEPIEVPESMGACLVRGLINQDRVRRYRAAWAAARGGDDPSAWKGEMGRLAPRKELYQDRLIVLSTGPYSAVPAFEMKATESDWLARSQIIRRDHECLHYLTLRSTGLVRRHALDEVVADLAGLLAADGRYDSPSALRFLGLEGEEDHPPHLASRARLRIYLEEAQLSPMATEVLLLMIVRAVEEIELCLERNPGLTEPARRTELLIAALRLGLTGLGDSTQHRGATRLADGIA